MLLASGARMPVLVDANEAREPLLGLYEWYREWSFTARTMITRRDWLVRLGVTRLRARQSLMTEVRS